MNRAISVEQLYKMKFETIKLEGLWAKSLGEEVEFNGVWIVWGQSGNGKTSFMIRLLKMLTEYGRGAYNPLEEGARFTFQRAAKSTNLIQANKKLIILKREPIHELKERLKKRRSPKVIVIDSIQYAQLTKADYIQLKEEFPDKLFLFTSHANGKLPEGKLADFVRYDADIKVFVDRYRAHITSRYGGGEYFDIWPERSKLLYDEVESQYNQHV